ncbi:transpeptidase [Paraglaciecola Antarctic JLT virus 2]|nr:transpeptidase [Paraglaciecola Antarctic JLT virus 2]
MILQRLASPSDRTEGILTLPDGSQFPTLERPWLENQTSISCIPAGHYKFIRDTHGRFQWFRVLDVPRRTHIEFHEGSLPSHSEGCILLSHDALTAMMWFFGDTELQYVLEIRS